MNSKAFHILLFILSPVLSIAQADKYTWADHLPYHETRYVVQNNEKVFCATEYALFLLDKNQESLEKLSKVQGLSDVQISSLALHPSGKYPVVGYSNGNIDIIRDHKITNVPHILNKQIISSKRINNIYFHGDIMFISCDFGIISYDLLKEEVKGSYFIGENSSYLPVYDLVIENNTIFAATARGVRKAKISDNLLDFNSWKKDSILPKGKYNQIEATNNRIYANLSIDGYGKDTLYYLENNQWKIHPPSAGRTLLELSFEEGKFIVNYQFEVDVYHKNDSQLLFTAEKLYDDAFWPMSSTWSEKSGLWIATKFSGLARFSESKSYSSFFPNGPNQISLGEMKHDGENLWVTPGYLDRRWNNHWNNAGLIYYEERTWKHIGENEHPGVDTLKDLVPLAINPDNPSVKYTGSWSGGLLRFEGKTLTDHYTQSNSGLSSRPEFQWVGVGGLSFDNSGNLWATNSYTDEPLVVKTASGNWYNFSIRNLVAREETIGEVITDDFGNKWITVPKKGEIIVYNENITYSDTTDDDIKHLKHFEGFGNIPGNDIQCITKDKKGHIWIGTNEGVGVHKNPQLVMADSLDFEQIKDEDGYHLLANEDVSAIAIDKNNRKWIGTLGSGVYFCDESGKRILQHFTRDNSPLFSNLILDIALDTISGEVFIGTDKGIVSIQSKSSNIHSVFSNVIAYPNPIKKGFNGSLRIKGLASNARIKITDISGNLVYNGITGEKENEVEWDLKNLQGKAVSPGVYVVFASAKEGDLTAQTKIMIQ